MKWIRTFPLVIPRNRSYVSDQVERVYIEDYNFSPLLDQHEDIAMLEWDIVLSAEQMAEWERRIRSNPDSIRVLPYRLPYHYDSTSQAPAWAHRHAEPADINNLEHLRQNRDWVREGDPTCELFGFGATYIPVEMLLAFADSLYYEREQWINDHHFSAWHWSERHESVTIDWDIRPIHLHT